jgi:hypothetical protein
VVLLAELFLLNPIPRPMATAEMATPAAPILRARLDTIVDYFYWLMGKCLGCTPRDDRSMMNYDRCILIGIVNYVRGYANE